MLCTHVKVAIGGERREVSLVEEVESTGTVSNMSTFDAVKKVEDVAYVDKEKNDENLLVWCTDWIEKKQRKVTGTPFRNRPVGARTTKEKNEEIGEAKATPLLEEPKKSKTPGGVVVASSTSLTSPVGRVGHSMNVSYVENESH